MLLKNKIQSSKFGDLIGIISLIDELGNIPSVNQVKEFIACAHQS